jgi:hypothetical protein
MGFRIRPVCVAEGLFPTRSNSAQSRHDCKGAEFYPRGSEG